MAKKAIIQKPKNANLEVEFLKAKASCQSVNSEKTVES